MKDLVLKKWAFFLIPNFSKKVHCVYGVSMTRKQDSGKRGEKRPTTNHHGHIDSLSHHKA